MMCGPVRAYRALQINVLLSHDTATPMIGKECTGGASDTDWKDIFDQALSLHQSDRLTEAAHLYRLVLTLNCRHADSLHLLGLIAHQTGAHGLALPLIEKAIVVDADVPLYHTHRGNVLKALGRLHDALSAHGAALRQKPSLDPVHVNQSAVLNELGRNGEALRSSLIAAILRPENIYAYFNHASALEGLAQHDLALASYDRALRLKPDFAEAHGNRAETLRGLGRFDDAIAQCMAAISVEPKFKELYHTLGNALCERNCLDKSVAAYGKALQIKSDFAKAHSSRLMGLHYDERTSLGEVFAAAQHYGSVFNREPEWAIVPNRPEPDRCLRVGYVSGDFCRHPVGYYLAAVLANHDRSAVEVFCYSNRARGDDVTVSLSAAADHWRTIEGMNDEEAARLVRADGIDILIDLAGHTGYNRLPMFALKPAPVQATWLGYWSTTGLGAIDYILSDTATILPGEERFYSERVVWLAGGRLCYAPPAYAPIPFLPPTLRNGITTFGSFNNLVKVGPQVVALWAAVLKAVPASRLLLKWRSLSDEATRSRFVQLFAKEGVAADRLILRVAAPHQAMLGEYGDIDIALDSSPFSGGLTSCEALWMGVPVVSLPSGGVASRQTAGFLQAIGHPELIAADRREYVRIAAALAADPERMVTLRERLRAEMAASSLCDGPGFTRRLEAAYRSMWRRWCEPGQRSGLGESE